MLSFLGMFYAFSMRGLCFWQLSSLTPIIRIVLWQPHFFNSFPVQSVHLHVGLNNLLPFFSYIIIYNHLCVTFLEIFISFIIPPIESSLILWFFVTRKKFKVIRTIGNKNTVKQKIKWKKNEIANTKTEKKSKINQSKNIPKTTTTKKKP